MILSICIPTYNRKPYLQALLATILPQLEKLDAADPDLELIVSDNASTDGTREYCQAMDIPMMRFWTNERNIGADRNFLKCIAEAKGDYVWLIGDDDLLSDNAVSRVLDFLRRYRPGLLASTEFGKSGEPKLYRNYVDALKDNKGGFVMAHTLISANVFRRDCFDMDFAKAKLWTQYAHMFGIMNGIDDASVGVMGAFVTVRAVRPEFAKFPSCLCVKQAFYLWYLARKLNMPGLYWKGFFNACNLPFEYASRVKNWILLRLRK